MTCISPPELRDEVLLAFLDGKAKPEIEDHLRICEHCHTRSKALARLHGVFTTQLYRIDCPDSQVLGEYQLKMLPKTEIVSIKKHVGECPHCTQELAQLEEFMSNLTEEVSLHPVDRVKILIAELISSPDQLEFAPAMVGIRGAEAPTFVYQAGELHISLDIQQDPTQPDKRAIYGLVTGVESSGWLAHLWIADELLSSNEVNEDGNFILKSLDPQEYEFFLSGPEVEIQIPQFIIEK